MRIHGLIQHIEERVETDLRVWRYLLPPREEEEGHEIQGSMPVWQPVTPTDHFICDTGEKTQRAFQSNLPLQLTAASAS